MRDAPTIDLNADVGEGFGAWVMGDDAGLLEVVTSASIACGFHAGDPSIMRRTCERAVERGVRIGAHVGYRDLAGFGRRHLGVDAGVLHDETLYQVGALAACARAAGGAVAYVKPHGALYHRCTHDAEAAGAVAAALRALDPAPAIVGFPGSALLREAAASGLDAVSEGFADRGYEPDGTLVERGRAGALRPRDDAVGQAVTIARDRRATAVDGSMVALDVRTLCVHGDTAGALALARAVRGALEDAGVTVAPFA